MIGELADTINNIDDWNRETVKTVLGDYIKHRGGMKQLGPVLRELFAIQHPIPVSDFVWVWGKEHTYQYLIQKEREL